MTNQATPYFNTTSFWQVLVGFDMNSIGVSDFVTVGDNALNVVDSFKVINNTAVGQIILELDRRMLIPPGGVVTTSHAGNVGMSVVQCETLGDALAIL